MGQFISRRAHEETFFGRRESILDQPAQLGGKTEGLPGAEGQAGEHAGHDRERGRGCGESGGSGEADYRGIAPDGDLAVVKKVVFDEMQFFPTNSTMQGEMRVKLEKGLN
jgi:hypothetical protein